MNEPDSRVKLTRTHRIEYEFISVRTNQTEPVYWLAEAEGLLRAYALGGGRIFGQRSGHRKAQGGLESSPWVIFTYTAGKDGFVAVAIEKHGLESGDVAGHDVGSNAVPFGQKVLD
jgi:hypothetical protein